MTLGVYGGAFDPPHNGHLAIARGAIGRFGLSRLVVLVSERPGHKEVGTGAETRLRLARAAFAVIPEAEVELDPHARTIDMLADGRFDGAVFVVGADEFADFLSWKEPEKVLEHVRLAVATRPGTDRAALGEVLAALRRPERAELFDIPPVDASSTDIRQRLATRRPVDDLVPPAVAELVEELGLYRQPAAIHSARPREGSEPT